MNKCIICGKLFEPPKEYRNKKTCSKECLSILKRCTVSKRFLKNRFKKNSTPFNKGKKQNEWMSKEGIEKCKQTYIQNQNCTSKFSKEEGRFLPFNTLSKGTVTQRAHVHRTGKNKGKVEIEFYINIDWKGNRKPNNLFKRFLWELYHQQDIPKGYVVHCKDGNPCNLEIANLELITRAELAKINRQGR